MPFYKVEAAAQWPESAADWPDITLRRPASLVSVIIVFALHP
jgi:hypothetical protein